jgi:hypothetical protein
VIKPLFFGILIGATIIYVIFITCEINFSKTLKLPERPINENEHLQFLEPIGTGGNLYLYDSANGKVWLVNRDGINLIQNRTKTDSPQK